MAYQVFARKWRPKQFSQLVGQPHIVQALHNALEQQRLHHAYLFSGTRGVGKTTLGRILAKCLNCEQGIVSTPCHRCEHCLAVDNGCFVDLYEIDAASRTRVEDTRELLENVPYAPTKGRFKIYLIDEVHMLSSHSFNALLKTLEEPPAHVKFILATTDPQKLPVTVLSRCLRFQLRAIGVSEITEQLAHILRAEQIEYAPDSLATIAQAALGSMRDALSLLEQAIALAGNGLEAHTVRVMLGHSGRGDVVQLIQGLHDQQGEKILNTVDQLAQQGVDFTHVLDRLLEALHVLALVQQVPNAQTPEIEIWAQEGLWHSKWTWSEEQVQLLYQIGLMGKRDLHFAPSDRLGLEMVLLRMLAFVPKRLVNPAKILTQEKPVEAPHLSQEVSKVSQAPSAQIRNSPPVEPPPVEKAVQDPHVPKEKASEKKSFDWLKVSNALHLNGLTRVLAKNCTFEHWEGNTITLMLDKTQHTCLNASRKTQIEQALQQCLGKEIQLQIEVGQGASPSPARLEKQAKKAHHENAIRTIKEDEHVQTIIQTFGANIEAVKVADEAHSGETNDMNHSHEEVTKK